MILFKRLSCDNIALINQQILDYITSLNFDQDCFWNPVNTVDFVRATPLLTEWLLKNQLPVKSIAITHGTHAGCCGPHTDTPPSRFKLSWPVLNTERTWNRWYRADADAVTEINALGGVSYVDPGNLTEIARMRVDQPAIIATGVPHDVWCEPNAVFPRWGLQCQLFNESEL